MKRYIQFEYLKISHFTAGQWQHPVHNHNHFEIIFIHRGKGKHCVSGMKYLYTAHTLFLLAPCDYHYFEIEEETEFTFIKFTNVYLDSIENIQVKGQWNRIIDQLLIHAGKQQQPLLKNEADEEKCAMLFRLIANEWNEKTPGNRETIFFLIQALLSVLKRNTRVSLGELPTKHHAKITAIIHYLHSNIYSAEHYRIGHLSEAFGFSRHYLGVFFKEQTGISLRDYIKQYKISLILNRLQYSSLSIKEISNELGFTDLSHFNKFFKNEKGTNPTAWRIDTVLRKNRPGDS